MDLPSSAPAGKSDCPYAINVKELLMQMIEKNLTAFIVKKI